MSGDDYIEGLRRSRKGSAVLKIRLAYLRSAQPTLPILAFEGPDDKVVYGQWIRRVREDFSYEPFLCEGKKAVRQLKNVSERDKTGIAENLYFVVDHDFDGLSGFVNTDGVYCTPAYSFENYLVNDLVLESLLRDEFPCHGQPAVRATIGEAFQSDYEAFLAATMPVNFRLFLARTVGIELAEPIPSSMAVLASVELCNVGQGNKKPSEIIKLMRQPTGAEVRMAYANFQTIPGSTNYRGKFAYKFFTTWLRKLAEEYANPQRGLFSDNDNNHAVRQNEFTLANFASKAPIPACFRGFVQSL